MKIVFLTTQDPLYLPGFFRQVLGQISDTVQSVWIVPPLYKGETSARAALKYLRTFGAADFIRLAWKVSQCKMRGQSIAAECVRHGVPCGMAHDVNDPDFMAQLGAQAPDLLVSVSCPQIFKGALISLPKQGILNIHGALLPRYRGVMPGFWMMANGETTAGVSIYFVNRKIDAGELCAQASFPIGSDETLDQFLRKSKTRAADLLLQVLRDIKKGRVERKELDLAMGSYYSWPDRKAVQEFRARGRHVW